ncbi:nickel transporter [Streptomyces chartreusis]|uniref:HoxN/HupN/NixA family nickel/cobalt transporter n=1 Tax=Streptomyces chartreusis TaxID=1969 RepID=UPI003862F59F|nr:nickel transporter [Streptomyces chartreusis]WTA26279.1 nickel transporter [Streptomyces chartreusis]
MTPRRLFASGAAALTAACALALFASPPASAHPLGNFTVNRYDGLVVTPGELRVHHVEDLAEIPATQAKPDIEKAGMTAWARQRCETAARGSEVTVDGRTVELKLRSSQARVRPGQAGLDTLRVECRLSAPVSAGATVALGFRSAGADSGPGWREVTARGDRMTLTASDVPKTSVSGELTKYPEELLSSPADTTTASLRVRPGGPALAESEQDAPAASVLPRGADRWTRALDDLVSRHELTFGFAALALVIAVFLGAMHALAPGHGKTIMAAVATARGGRARLKDVMPLAASVTVTHTLGVVALGLLITAGSAAAPSVITWLGMASGALVLAAGATLVRRAWHIRKHGYGHGHSHDHDHEHPHDHGDQPHEHTHETDHPHTHDREPVLVAAHAHSPTETPTAPQPLAHTHTPAHPHPHHPHPHPHHPHNPTPKRGLLTHTHGGFTHTHSTAPTLRGTILLGFAGGLVPSPSAVVVLVGAAALGKAWFGLLLVVAYGVGLALTLTAAGFAVVKLGTGVTRVLDRRPRWTAHPVTTFLRRTAPLASALLVVLLGAGLVFKGAASVLG